MSRGVVAVLALIILMSGAVVATEAALESAGEDHRVVNESFNATQGSVTTLDDSDITGAYYAHNVTVYNATTNGSAEMEPGTDYEWFTGNGTVKPLTGGNLTGTAEITYEYQRTTQLQRSMANTLAWLPRLVGLLVPLAIVVFFFAFLAGT